jgi:hypothetical protein
MVKRERLHRGQDLRDHEDAMAVPAVGEHARERGQDEQRNLTRESGDAEEELGAGQAIDEPARGDARDPRADQRNALPGKEETVVAVREGTGEAGHLRVAKGQGARPIPREA